MADLQEEVRDLKRRLDLAETRLIRLEGSFEFVSGQLRDMQLYMHAQFEAIDKRFDRLEARFGKLEAKVDGLDTRFNVLEAKVDAMPRAILEGVQEMFDKQKQERSR